jgi:hypothetical protein
MVVAMAVQAVVVMLGQVKRGLVSQDKDMTVVMQTLQETVEVQVVVEQEREVWQQTQVKLGEQEHHRQYLGHQ